MPRKGERDSVFTGFLCPTCKGPTRVIGSTQAGEQQFVRRRRECNKCKHRFSTLEKVYATEDTRESHG